MILQAFVPPSDSLNHAVVLPTVPPACLPKMISDVFHAMRFQGAGGCVPRPYRVRGAMVGFSISRSMSSKFCVCGFRVLVRLTPFYNRTYRRRHRLPEAKEVLTTNSKGGPVIVHNVNTLSKKHVSRSGDCHTASIRERRRQVLHTLSLCHHRRADTAEHDQSQAVAIFVFVLYGFRREGPCQQI